MSQMTTAQLSSPLPPQLPLISVRGLFKSHRDGQGRPLEVLRGVNLDLHAGDTLAISGVSGAGKSTLLHLIGQLDLADAGTISIAGRDTSTFSTREAARFRNETLGFVFQFHHLLMDFDALENVMMPMWIRAGRVLPLEAEALALLRAVGLEDLARRRPARLSGGEQQRLAIARALANRPRILLADEPSGNLDIQNAAQLQKLLLRLNRENGLTIILATHNLGLAQEMSRQCVLRRGVLHEEPSGQRKELRSEAAVGKGGPVGDGS